MENCNRDTSRLSGGAVASTDHTHELLYYFNFPFTPESSSKVLVLRMFVQQLKTMHTLRVYPCSITPSTLMGIGRMEKLV